MERTDFKAILDPLVLALRADFDLPMWTVYYQALADVPPNLLQAAVTYALRSDRAFVPKPGELRALAEKARLELSLALKFQGCEQCHGSGWDTILIDGISRVQRCACWKAHQQKLATAGVTLQPVALLSEGEEGA
jgi:hypothetical protein